MKKKIVQAVSMLLLCLTVSGCGTMEIPENIAGRADGYFRAKAAYSRQRADVAAEEKEYRIFSTGYLVFALPADWEEVYPARGWVTGQREYSRGGNTGRTVSSVWIWDMSCAEEICIVDMFRNKGKAEMFPTALFGGSIVRMKIKDIKKCSADNTALAVIRTAGDGRKWDWRIYIRGRGRHVYIIGACRPEGGRKDVFDIAELIFRSGVFR